MGLKCTHPSHNVDILRPGKGEWKADAEIYQSLPSLYLKQFMACLGKMKLILVKVIHFKSRNIGAK